MSVLPGEGDTNQQLGKIRTSLREEGAEAVVGVSGLALLGQESIRLVGETTRLASKSCSASRVSACKG